MKFTIELWAEEVSKSSLKKTIEESVDDIKATATTTTTTTTTTTMTTTPEGCGDGPPELEDKTPFFDDIVIAMLVKEDTSPEGYAFIIPESLEPDAFVICENECESEGFWMMIGKFT